VVTASGTLSLKLGKAPLPAPHLQVGTLIHLEVGFGTSLDIPPRKRDVNRFDNPASPVSAFNLAAFHVARRHFSLDEKIKKNEVQKNS